MTIRPILLASVTMALVLSSISPARSVTPAFEDNALFWRIDVEQWEYMTPDDEFYFEGEGQVGNDDHRASMKLRTYWDSQFKKPELQFLYIRRLTPFFDLGAGVRQDAYAAERTYGVLRLAGLAPQWIDTDASLFMSETGVVSGRLENRYDIDLGQKLVFHPLLEINFSFGDDAKKGTYAGVNDLTLGGRLSYAVHPSIFPYIGIDWDRNFGKAADYARMMGEDSQNLSLVIGTKMAF